MWPMAWLYFNKILIERTKAQSDQQNIETMLYNKNDIPDRTQCILNDSDEVVFPIVMWLKSLELLGCNVLVMACNTAHYFYDKIFDQVNNSLLLNMVNITSDKIYNDNIKSVILLATDGTIRTNLYQQYLSKLWVNVVIPNDKLQQKIMSIIYDLKSWSSLDALQVRLVSIISQLKKESNIESLILWCTELSVIMQNLPKKNIYDPIEEVIEYIKKYLL